MPGSHKPNGRPPVAPAWGLGRWVADRPCAARVVPSCKVALKKRKEKKKKRKEEEKRKKKASPVSGDPARWPRGRRATSRAASHPPGRFPRLASCMSRMVPLGLGASKLCFAGSAGRPCLRGPCHQGHVDRYEAGHLPCATPIFTSSVLLGLSRRLKLW
jgi:hypothetical protein